MQLYRLSCNTPSKLIIFQSKKILFSKMVSSKLRLTDQFSDASTEHTCSFIFYWLAQFVMLGPILEQDVRKRSLNWYWGKLIFHTIGIKHCISNFINSKMGKKKHDNTPKGQNKSIKIQYNPRCFHPNLMMYLSFMIISSKENATPPVEK